MPDAFDHCEQLVREGDKDRFLATLFASPKHRRPLWALYAFNLDLARIRDQAKEPMPGEIRLQWWRDVFGAGARGEVAAHPVASALRETVVRYSLPLATIERMIDARGFDLYDDPMGTRDELQGYASQTSSALMSLAARVLNEGKAVRAGAAAIGPLGIAYAIAGLLQNLPLHASRGQIYLPLDVLAQHGADPADVLAGRDTPQLRAALASLRDRARAHLEVAQESIGAVPPAVLPALLPASLVRPILRRMDRRSYRPFAPSLLPQWRRQWTLWRAARRGGLRV